MGAEDAHRGDFGLSMELTAALPKQQVLSQQKHPAVDVTAGRALHFFFIFIFFFTLQNRVGGTDKDRALICSGQPNSCEWLN